MSDFVLIADSDVERGRRIATACHAQGMRTNLATHGAGALEIALAEKPFAVVAQLDLPLIDGPRLAEILHANPRTQAIGVLFVADEDSRVKAPSPEATGRILPGHSDPETIARFVEALLAKRSARDARRRETPGGVEGQLSQIALTELLELFHVNRKTGTVELRRGSRRGEIGRVYLREGDVIQATTGPVDGEKALYRLFSWDRGTFSFRPGPVLLEPRIDRPTRALLREGKRQAREWDRLSVDLPSRHAHVTLKVSRASLPNVLHPLTQEVLLVLELSDRVQDVLDRSSFPDYQVLRTLHTLARRGMVELRTDTGGPDDATGIFASAPAARLREWIDSGRPRGAPTMDAKVVVVPSEPGAGRSFAALLGRLPGADLPSPPSAPAVAPLARLPVDEEIGLEVIEVPAAARFAPVWPLAVHGALATLFVHSGQAALSVEAVRRPVENIASAPRARMFHVLLQDKEDRDAVHALCESLSLFDDRSIVAIPLDRPDDAMTALRALLARLLP